MTPHSTSDEQQRDLMLKRDVSLGHADVLGGGMFMFVPLFTDRLDLNSFFCTATEPTTSFNLFVGNLNFSKSAPELKTGISDIFAKNDLAVVDVRIGVSR